MVSEYIIEKRIKKSDFSKKKDVHQKINKALKMVDQALFIEKEIDVSNGEIKATYDKLIAKSKGQKEIELARVVLKTKEQAEKAIEQLKKDPKSFDEVVKRSIDPKVAQDGGVMGYVRKEQIPEKKLAENLFKLSQNTVLDKPFSAGEGLYLVFFVKDKRDAKPPAMDDVKTELTQVVRMDKTRDYLQNLKKKSKAKILNLDGKEIPELKDGEQAPAVDEKIKITKLDPNMMVASFDDGHKIKLNDVINFVKETAPQASDEEIKEIFPALVEQLALSYLLEKEVAKSNITSSDKAQKKRAQAEKDLLQRLYIEENVKQKISEKDIRKQYDELKSMLSKQNQQEVSVRHILVDSEDKAKELIKDITKNPTTFDDMVKKESIDEETKEKRGELPPILLDGNLDPVAKEILKRAPTGTLVTKPVKLLPSGWSVVRCESRSNRRIPKIEELEGELKDIVFAKKLQDFIKNLEKDEKVDIVGEPIQKDESISSEEEETRNKDTAN